MGLDMYLFRTGKIEGMSAMQYAELNASLDGLPAPDEKGEITVVNPTLANIAEARRKVPPELQNCVHTRGEFFKVISIFDEVAYWRKANAIHLWFVEATQEGVDECGWSFVNKGDLESLMRVIMRIKNGADPKKLLPTRSGFFFGETSYGASYMHDIHETYTQITEVMETTDWKNQVLIYHASW
jgi:hypothetical protein